MSVSKSHAEAMYEVLHKKLLATTNAWIEAEIYKPGRFAQLFSPYRIKVSWWAKGRSRKSSIMKMSVNGKSSFVDVKIPGHFKDPYDRQVRNLDACSMSIIFNEICKLSDEGYSLVYMNSELCKKKEPVEFIKPYEGSSLQIEADLLAPDFAWMDKPIEVLF